MRSVAGAALALLLAAGCSSGGGDGASTTTTAPGDTTSTTEAVILQGEPLVVADQGVSAFPDPFDPASTLGGYGVVLHNPNPDLMAVGVRVTSRILDPAGAELLVDRSLLNAVMPGTDMAVGRTLIEPIADPTAIEVAVEVAAWAPVDEPAPPFAAEAVTTEADVAGGAVTRFTVRSDRTVAEEAVDVTAVYRAADGRILGAETTTLASVPAGATTPGQIRLLSPIPSLATTDVYVGRGIAAQTGG